VSIDDYMHMLASKRRKLRCSWWDIRVCVSPGNHRKYWFYAGPSRFYCEVCLKLAYIA